jgi:glycosyltransferase involved in cell wall biosynthesis
MIARAGLGASVRLTGPLPNAEVIERLPSYRALLLPSRNETFGMVYVEALFAGIPVLFTRGTAIDGYLDGLDVAVTVPEGDAQAIGQAILRLDRETDRMRTELAASAAELHRRFDPERVLAGYRVDIASVATSVPSHPRSDVRDDTIEGLISRE